ncbi:MAG: tRNA pseudouridine(55) synthase TruB [Anaerolineae bacterium]|nr:tRNA pseudouridine(55) synthase TruB [Candidatus Roseilinea sp.]MDW8449974.1 tRNA pseudouridine(55) synthase TruB [Anaerolineae bacterium]
MDGLLIVDKPRGMASHDVVARARRLLREKRIGHAGTLDPLATGVLVLCIGQATRLSEYLLGEDKAYAGVIRLGQRTTTDDAEGEVIATRPVPPLTEETLRQLEARFTGTIAQTPPQFSAIQKGGQRAYALARQGRPVELAPRQVTVYELRLALPGSDDSRLMTDDFPPPTPDSPIIQSSIIQSSIIHHQSSGAGSGESVVGHLCLFVRCSAGTYVRALARDIGEALGCGGHLVALRRMQAGRFTLADAVTLDQVEAAVREGKAASLLLPMDRAVADWPAVHLSDADARRLKMGQAIALPQPVALPSAARGVRVYDSRRTFIAIAHWDGTKLKPAKVFDAAPPLVR